jgi:hypothetical protein
VLALYLVVAVAIVVMGCVSLNFSVNYYLASHSIADFVISSGQY